MASGMYALGKQDILAGTADLDNTTAARFKACLVSTGYTFGAGHDFDTTTTGPSNFRIGTDQSLTSVVVATTGTNQYKWDAADPTWTAVAGGSTIGGVVIYRNVTNDADAVPLVFLDLTDTATNGGDITVTFDATNGIFYW